MPTAEKVAFVEMFAEKLAGAKSLFVTDHTGLDAAKTTEIRRQFRAANVEYRIVKNTLTKLAAERARLHALLEYLTGPTSIALGGDDPAAPARVIAAFNKGGVTLAVRACCFEGHWFDGGQLQRLAEIPTREVMIAQLLSGITMPLRGLTSALRGVGQRLVGVLAAVRDQKGSEV